jgi:hypothetical protein
LRHRDIRLVREPATVGVRAGHSKAHWSLDRLFQQSRVECCSTPRGSNGLPGTGFRPFAKGVVGADNVARVLASIFPVFDRIDARVEPREVNGQPGAILRDRDHNVVSTLTLEVLGGRIQTIRAVISPDKLGHLGPVADAWAVAREVNQARRRELRGGFADTGWLGTSAVGVPSQQMRCRRN